VSSYGTARAIDQEAVAFDRRSFRDALSTFPTGVTVVTTMTADRELVGITANSFSSVSLDPPLVSFSLARRAFSMQAFVAAEAFAVSVLAFDQGAISNRFAVSSDRKWEGANYVIAANGCPIIAGALASFECAPHAQFDGGDHVIFVGRVTRFERLATGEPLVFSRGSYRTLAPSAEFPDYSSGGAKVLPPINGFDPWTSG
jgi:flavin reductase (DIM6/NTAB) family NADH-FMN oxidoreductase RutF